jgi:hypothetical protein
MESYIQTIRWHLWIYGSSPDVELLAVEYRLVAEPCEPGQWEQEWIDEKGGEG